MVEEAVSDPVGKVVHFSPGRVRVRLEPSYRTAENLAQITSLLNGLEGIQSVETKLDTGSVLIRFDPVAFDQAALLSMASSLGISVPAASGSGLDEVGARLRTQYASGQLARSLGFLVAAIAGRQVAPLFGLSPALGAISAVVATMFVGRAASRRR